MDVVITYVNGLDPLWLADYASCVGGDILSKRFRDWGTLKYVMRGIERHMPFIDNVILVVARESQIPSWVNRENVRVVLHSEFIPQKFLPTFNGNTIETYLHNIPGLSEQYIYFNDDLFPVRDMTEESFFKDGKALVWCRKHVLALNMFKKITRKSDSLARKFSGLRPSPIFIRPQHTASAMIKSLCEEAFAIGRTELEDAITPIRTAGSPCQYIYTDYMYHRGFTLSRKASNRHFSLAVANADKISAFLENPDADMACINDVQMSDEKFRSLNTAILAAFEKAFPAKSRFEI